MKPIKRTYFLNSIALLRGFPGSQNCIFKAAVVRKVSNPAGIVDLLRELVCRQTKVGISSSSPSIRTLERLITIPSSSVPNRPVRPSSGEDGTDYGS